MHQVFLKASSNSAHEQKLSLLSYKANAILPSATKEAISFWVSHPHGLHPKLLYELKAILDLTQEALKFGKQAGRNLVCRSVTNSC